MSKDVPPLFNTFLYDKWIIDRKGNMEISEYPIECFLGQEWDYLIYHERAAVAYSINAGDQPYNAFWESARDPKRHCRLKGTVVLFRHNFHMRPDDIYPDFKVTPKRMRCEIL